MKAQNNLDNHQLHEKVLIKREKFLSSDMFDQSLGHFIKLTQTRSLT
jgi:hypothetical protein